MESIQRYTVEDGGGGALRNSFVQSNRDPMPTILILLCGMEPSMVPPLSMAPERKRRHLLL